MKSKRKLVIITAIVICLLCAIVAVTVAVNRKNGNTFHNAGGVASDQEAGGYSNMSDDSEDGEEPAEFQDEPDIIIPAVAEEIETMVPQESGEIDLEENQDGSF